MDTINLITDGMAVVILGGAVWLIWKFKGADDPIMDKKREEGVKSKARRTRRLLEYLAGQDAGVDIKGMEERVRQDFNTKWEVGGVGERLVLKSDVYEGLLGMPDLRNRPLEEGRGRIKTGGVEFVEVEVVAISWTQKISGRMFTALVSAIGEVDESGEGGEGSRGFKEIWDYKAISGEWKVSGVQRAEGSRVLRGDNYVEGMSLAEIRMIEEEGEEKFKDVEEEEDDADEGREENDEEAAGEEEERVREVFGRVMRARQSLLVEDVEGEDLFGEVAEQMRGEAAQRKTAGAIVEYRELRILKVEIKMNGEVFVAGILAEAQRFLVADGEEKQLDAGVEEFRERWKFGRLGDEWCLEAILGA